MDKLEKSRQLLSTAILKNFVGRITGAGLDRIVGSNPENVLLVGKLMSTNDADGQNANSSKTFIKSIGVDFYISESDLDNAVIRLFPQGDFYYRAIPTLEEQRMAMLREINDSHDYNAFDSFEDVAAAYKINPANFSNYQIKLIPVYKKISLTENAQVFFKLKDVLDESGECGFICENHSINGELDSYLQGVQVNINNDEEAMSQVITEPTKVEHLLSSASYNSFLQNYANRRVQQKNQNWKIYFDIQVKKTGIKYLVSCFLVNNSIVLYSGSHRSRKDDKFTIETLFNSGIRIELENADFCPIELDFFEDDYKYDKTQYALSNNCAVEFNKAKNALQTNHLPLYEQYRLITNDTGGGKTEAFLGVLVFNLFFDRHRGKSCGVTSILRYPLRLLSVQQVQRLANVLAKAELIRRADKEICGTECFSLGYFVGDNNTPNEMSAKEYARYREMNQAQRDEHRVLDVCPFCGKQSVHIRADEYLSRLVHFCDNPECQSGGDLPLYIVDSEIYRYLPSAIISTVDKLAIVGCNANFRNILNGGEYKCPVHGYTSKKKCIERTCKLEVQEFETVDMYDPAPTLFIQDELHLIRESLGTYASHYESFLKYYIRNISKSKRDVKIIGATATISSYREVYHLYGRNPIRFPCESPFIEKNFYAEVDKEDLQRQILGYAPYGKAIVNSVVYSLKYMREAVFEYYKDPQKILDIPNIGISTKEEALELLKDYWIFLEYNNVKRDGNNVDGAIKTPVNEELSSDGIIPFKTRAMTGDESFQDVREVLAEVENNNDVYGGVNLITATSMISHGVDADRFNVMFFYGIPGNMAESYGVFTVAGAISLRGRLRGMGVYEDEADFEGKLQHKLKNEYDERIRFCDTKNGQLQSTAENMRLSILGKDSKTKDEKPLGVVDTYVKENTTELVDPLEVQKKLSALEEKRSTLLRELDTQIKVSNATTFIEIM